MKKSLFLTLVAVVASAVGLFALLAPSTLLASKGVENNPAASVWMMEVGVALLAIGILVFGMRNEQNPAVLRPLFVSMLLVQAGLLVIEWIAFFNGVITEMSGIIPNSLLHLVLILGFGFYLARLNR